MTPDDLDDAHGLADDLHRLAARDDATTAPALADAVGALTGRVRRRRRAKTLGTGAVTLSVAGVLALVVVPGVDRDRTPQVAAALSTRVGALCGRPLDTPTQRPGDAVLTVTDATPSMTGDDAWTGIVTHEIPHASDLATPPAAAWGGSELVLVGTTGETKGLVVGAGTSTMLGAGSLGGDTTGTGGPGTTRVESCAGGPLEPGAYSAVVVDLGPGDDAHGRPDVERVSNASPLEVLAGAVAGGEQPAWLAGTSLVCGMTASAAGGVLSAVTVPGLDTGFVLGDGDGTGLRLTNHGTDPLTLTVGARPALLWVDHATGKVTTFGADELAATRTLRIEPGTHVDYLGASLDPTDRCTPGATGAVPAGVYDVWAYTRVPSHSTDRSVAFLSQGSVQVLVRADGSVTADAAQVDAAATSAAGAVAGFQPSWVEGSPLRCLMTWDQFRGASSEGAPLRFGGSDDPRTADGPLGTTLTPSATGDSAGASTAFRTAQHLGLAWFSRTADGGVGPLVSFGADPGPARDASVAPDGTFAADAPAQPVASCGGSGGTTPPATLAPGSYWVAFYTWVQAPGGARHWITDSAAQGIAVDAHGTER